jgi:hypothetical protein
MPCYTVQTTTLDVGLMQPRHLADALADIGYTVTAHYDLMVSFYGHDISGRYVNGRLTTQGGDIDLARLKQAYSTRLVKATARKNGWKLKKQTAENKYVFSRR